jgi:hypothetical protein
VKICKLAPSRLSDRAAWQRPIRPRHELRAVAEEGAERDPTHELNEVSLTAGCLGKVCPPSVDNPTKYASFTLKGSWRPCVQELS